MTVNRIEGVRDGHGQALAVFDRLLLFAQHLTVGRDAIGAGCGVLILQGILRPRRLSST